MPKATLTFSLPEEQSEFNTASKAGDMYCVLWDIDTYLRNKLKYQELTIEQAQVYEEVRNKLREFLNERNIEL